MKMKTKGVKTTGRTLRLLGILTASAWLAGCAGTPQKNTQDEFGVFSDGKSSATYATAFPVGSPEEAYRNGDAAVQSGDYDRALFEYIRGLRLADTPSAEALYKIGYIHYQRDNYRLASLAFRWVLKLEPDNARAGTGLGEVLLKTRHYKEAEKQLRGVVIAHGQAPWRAYNGLGILLDIQGKGEEAEKVYQEALKVNPNSALVLNNLGYSRYLRGDWDGANEALESALRAQPGYELAWRNLGLVHARQGDYDYALEALERSSKPAQAYNDVGYVTMISGDYSRALSFFEEAMRQSPAYYVTASENARNVQRKLNRMSGSDL